MQFILIVILNSQLLSAVVRLQQIRDFVVETCQSITRRDSRGWRHSSVQVLALNCVFVVTNCRFLSVALVDEARLGFREYSRNFLES